MVLFLIDMLEIVKNVNLKPGISDKSKKRIMGWVMGGGPEMIFIFSW
jgi:hypothetical protein